MGIDLAARTHLFRLIFMQNGGAAHPPPHAHLNSGAHILRKSQFGKYPAKVVPEHLLVVQQCNCLDWWHCKF